jgi:hypothetical protein
VDSLPHQHATQATGYELTSGQDENLDEGLRRRDFFLILHIFILLEQSRRSAGSIGFSHSISPGSPSVSSCHFEANGSGVLKD